MFKDKKVLMIWFNTYSTNLKWFLNTFPFLVEFRGYCLKNKALEFHRQSIQARVKEIVREFSFDSAPLCTLANYSNIEHRL